MEFFTFVNAADSISMYSGDALKNYLWAYFLAGALIFAIIYVLQGIALYTIGKREGYGKCWMAFVPFVNVYYMGVVSQKNSVVRLNTKVIGLIVAILNAVLVALEILSYVAIFLVFRGGYATPIYEDAFMYGKNQSLQYVSGYVAHNLPNNLRWAWWVFENLDEYITYWINFVYLIFNIFLTIAFFRTYSSGRYVLFSVVSIIFPIRGILMFAVKNNRGKSYVEYIREQQQRQYRAYQEYMRNNPPPPNNGYYGNNYQNQGARKPDDPFDGMGESSSNKKPDDPFDL